MHTREENQPVLNRLSRAAGHLESVRRMVEEGQDCSQVLIQLSAVQSALSAAGRTILKNHLNHCILKAAETGDSSALEELSQAVDRFMR